MILTRLSVPSVRDWARSHTAQARTWPLSQESSVADRGDSDRGISAEPRCSEDGLHGGGWRVAEPAPDLQHRGAPQLDGPELAGLPQRGHPVQRRQCVGDARAGCRNQVDRRRGDRRRFDWLTSKSSKLFSLVLKYLIVSPPSLDRPRRFKVNMLHQRPGLNIRNATRIIGMLELVGASGRVIDG